MPAQVQIRRYTLEDINPVFEATHESVPEVMRWMPWSSPNYSLDDARTWVRPSPRLGRKESVRIPDG